MGWVLIVTNPDHNHAAKEPQAHSIHWQNGLSIELLNDLQQSCDAGIKSDQFLAKLHMEESDNLLKSHNIYNTIA